MVGPRDPPPAARAGRWLAKFQRRSGVSLIGQLNCLIPDNSSLFRLENSLFNSLGNWPPRPAESLAFWGRERDRQGAKSRNSLFISLLAGNSGQRRVRSRLAPPPSLLRQFPRIIC